jgi:release factor glutamine methyltransferase
MQISQQIRQTCAQIAPVAGEMAGLEARLLVAHVLGFTPEDMVARAHQPLVQTQTAQIASLIARRLEREPLAQILGRKPFWRDEFLVSPAVLTPRPDSETILEYLGAERPDRAAPLRILDLGTGSGCLLLSALREYPQATGLGVDKSDKALEVARKNANQLGLSPRAHWQLGDWAQGLSGPFDVVLTNPPYIPTNEIAQLEPEVRCFEPRSALDGGADGLDPALKARASWSLSLSPLTFPHELARLLLLEQLYRALTIQQGGAYHRA